MNITVEFSLFELVQAPSFILITILALLPKFSQKENLQFQRENVNLTIEFSIFELIQMPNFILSQICPKTVFLVQNRKSKHHRRIQDTRISIGTYFHLKHFLFFGPDFPKQGIFGSKQKKYTSPSNSAYSKQFRHQVSFETDNFDIMD